MRTRNRTTDRERRGPAFERFNGSLETKVAMRGLARWCVAHRRRVVVGWIAVAVLTTVVAHAVGPNYVTAFGLPGTESQRALDLLKRDFKAQSGDADAIVFHVSHGTIDSPAVRAAIVPTAGAGALRCRMSPGSSAHTRSRGAVQVSPNRMTAFATVNYDQPANVLPERTGKPLLAEVARVHVPGLQVAAGGQVVENAEGFSVGPATEVGVLAALIILLLTFGSLAAAGMPLITAGLGSDHGRGADRAWHPRDEHVEYLARAGADDRPRGRDRLRAVHRHPLPRELRSSSATSSGRSSRRWTPPAGRSCSPARPS